MGTCKRNDTKQYITLIKTIILSQKTELDQSGTFESAQWVPKPPIQSIGRDLLFEDLYVLSFMMDARKFLKLGTKIPTDQSRQTISDGHRSGTTITIWRGQSNVGSAGRVELFIFVTFVSLG